MTTQGRFPKVFSADDPVLKSLLPGQSLSYGGCVPNIGGTQAGSGLYWCSYFMKYNQGDNDEFTLGLGDVDRSCRMCSLNYGCADVHDAKQQGERCLCNFLASWYSGRECIITRASYTGDPSSCCLKKTSSISDSQTTGIPRINDPSQFSWENIVAPGIDGDTYSCDPSLLETCDSNAATIAFYCSTLGNSGTQLAWKPGQPSPKDRDPTGYCSNFVNSMNASGNKGAAQTVLGGAVNYMANTPGFKDFGKSNPKNAKTVSNLLQFCSNSGTCDAQLKVMCKPHTREEIFDAYKKYLDLTRVNPNDENAVAYKNIFQACGCHLPPTQYTEWGNLGVDEVNVACDPMCMLPNVIPQFNNGVRAQCSQSLCVLDNITIDIINSQTGDINFITLCGNCTRGNCRCIFSNINVVQSGSSVGNINFEQNCGGNCSSPDPNNPGNFIQIDCKTGLSTGTVPTAVSAWTKIFNWIKDNKWKTALIIIIVIIVIYLTYRFFASEKPAPKPTAEKVTLSDLYGDYAEHI